jgi:KaiC/GvpD/RAD55 family RecA-like ATPase
VPVFLRFGIPSLDKLIGRDDRNYGFDLSRKEPTKDSTGLCVIGPDGTGKSVFALHLASQYLADCFVERTLSPHSPLLKLPQILYISTDLSYGKATKTWKHFGLDKPFARTSPFEEVYLREPFKKDVFKDKKICLAPYTPPTVVEYLQAESKEANQELAVCFIDLASSTAGDDWGFLHRLLALMQMPTNGNPPHLVIVDAVEGFETYAGTLDAFGESSSRRARIAQLARLTMGKAHTLLIVEQMKASERLPEEFVADIVIRLRNVEANKYLRRTVEIEKTRGQSHVRGQHPFSIRVGKGSTTGSQANVDDPEVRAFAPADGDYPFQDYVQVFPSLSYLNRAVMSQTHAPRPPLPENQFAAFGISYLDNMLGGEGFEAEPRQENEQYYDTRGLPAGTVTALIGDSLTQKTRLGRWFLSRSFFPFFFNSSADASDSLEAVAEVLQSDPKMRQKLDQIRELRDDRKHTYPLAEQLAKHRELNQLKKGVAGHKSAEALLRRCGVVLLFATHDTHHEALVSEFLEIFGLSKERPEYLIAQILMEERTICRRMEIHDVPASTFAHIFQENIQIAKNALRGDKRSPHEDEGVQFSRVRVVFDDFNSLRNTYNEVSADPLFLPYLLFFLGRQGITALIVDTQSISKPQLALTERYESELRELVQHRLYTWRVPFYGENRVAITAIPPFSPSTSGAIRELRWEGRDETVGNRTRVVVSPHFELYTGLEEGKLQPVPIEIRFYAENEAFNRYLDMEESRFIELFVPHKREGQTSPVVLFRYGPEDYSTMRDFCGLQRGTRLDHTLVFQVDEFWTLRPQRSGRSGAWNYLTTPTWANGSRDELADPYAVFQPTRQLQQGRLTRLDFYDQTRVPYIKDYRAKGNEKTLKTNLDRVPFSWDFGFLLCKGSAWKEAAGEELIRQGKDEESLMEQHHCKYVKDVWDSLTQAGDGDKGKQPVSWFAFLAAGKRVAEHQSYKNPSVAHTFDFSVFSPETFPSLVLEIWASEIWKDYRTLWDADSPRRAEMKTLTNRPISRSVENVASLLRWLEPDRGKELRACVEERFGSERVETDEYGFSLQLYKTWLLLVEAIDFSDLFPTLNAFSLDLKPRQVNSSVVAARHWYKTACHFNESITEQELEANWIPVRLPGHFSVRGDWFLTVAGGSRSSRLADRALDLLGSKRANITRLQEGIGLPVRSLVSEEEGELHLSTRLVTLDGPNLDGPRLRALPYKHFLTIAETGDSRDFFWLWRSSFVGFNSGLRIWHRWLSQMVIWWRSKRLKYASSWTNGFHIYAQLENLRLLAQKSGQPVDCGPLIDELKRLDSWKEFHERVKELVDSLREVNIESE